MEQLTTIQQLLELCNGDAYYAREALPCLNKIFPGQETKNLECLVGLGQAAGSAAWKVFQYLPNALTGLNKVFPGQEIKNLETLLELAQAAGSDAGIAFYNLPVTINVLQEAQENDSSFKQNWATFYRQPENSFWASYFAALSGEALQAEPTKTFCLLQRQRDESLNSLALWLSQPDALEQCRRARPGLFAERVYEGFFHPLGGRIWENGGWSEVFPKADREGYLRELALPLARQGKATGIEIERFDKQGLERKTLPTTDSEVLLGFLDRGEAWMGPENVGGLLPESSSNLHWNRSLSKAEKERVEKSLGDITRLASLLFLPANSAERNHHLMYNGKPLVGIEPDLQGDRPDDVARLEVKLGSLRHVRYQFAAIEAIEEAAKKGTLKKAIERIEARYHAFRKKEAYLLLPGDYRALGKEPDEETFTRIDAANAKFRPWLQEELAKGFGSAPGKECASLFQRSQQAGALPSPKETEKKVVKV